MKPVASTVFFAILSAGAAVTLGEAPADDLFVRLDGPSREALAEVLAATPSTLRLDRNGIPDGWMVIEGDMIVPESAGAATYQGNLWPSGIVPYLFDSNTTSGQRTAMLAAMAEWESVATIDFQPWVGQSNRIRIRDSSDDLIPNNSSQVGMVGGEQIINIVSWGTHYTLMHELAHALAVHHEQSRTDRDEYVQIEWDNIPVEYWSNFALVPWADRFGAYDFESIMHYPECGFSNCGDLGCSLNPDICRTITVLPAYEEWQSLIGNRSYLSALDGMSMSFLYPQPTWRFVDHTYQGTSTGTFLQPWNSFIIAYASEPSGVTLHLEPGSYLAIGTWSKNLTLKAPLGGVVLGTN